MHAELFDISATARMVCIFLHVLALAAAGAGIAFGDYAIFAGRRIDSVLLHRAGQIVTTALLALWTTGLTVIWMDTGFDLAVLETKSKLLAKLTVVTLLTTNGIALHQIVFKPLCDVKSLPPRTIRLFAILGAISAVTWLHAAFLGLAKPFAPLLGYSGFMGLYAASLAIAIPAALLLMAPRLAQRFALIEPAPANIAAVTSASENIPDSELPRQIMTAELAPVQVVEFDEARLA